jgi:protein-disulfide isomerase
LKKILQNFPNDVRVVMKHNALAFHNRAMPAAEAAMAAHAQGKFWEMHDAIFAKMRELTDEGLEKRAQEVGLDMGAFKKAMSSHKYKGQIEADMALAEKVRSRGTPSFYVNGRNIRGAQPYENFESLVKEELAKAKTLCGDVPGAKCYAERIIAKGKVFEPLEAKVNTFTTDGRPFEGNPKGDIIITEFSDFQ